MIKKGEHWPYGQPVVLSCISAWVIWIEWFGFCIRWYSTCVSVLKWEIDEEKSYICVIYICLSTVMQMLYIQAWFNSKNLKMFLKENPEYSRTNVELVQYLSLWWWRHLSAQIKGPWSEKYRRKEKVEKSSSCCLCIACPSPLHKRRKIDFRAAQIWPGDDEVCNRWVILQTPTLPGLACVQEREKEKTVRE